MTRHRNESKLALRLFLAVVFLFAAAFSEKDEFISKDGVVYMLQKQLGSGDYGEVWKVLEKGKRKSVALKFYKDKKKGREHIQRVEDVAIAIQQHPPQNILRVYAPERVFKKGTTEQYDVVPAELGDGTVESLANREFDLTRRLTKPETIRRVQNARALLDDLVSAAEQFHDLGYVHNDLNPRNVIKVKKQYKAGDLDGVTRIGQAPPSGAAEYNYMAIEYNNDKMAALYGPLSDLNTVASTVFYAMFGYTPLSAYAAQEYGQTFKENRLEALKRARRDLFRDEPGAREAYEKLIRTQFAEAFDKTPAKAAADFQKIAKWVTAALTVDPEKRRENLKAVAPKLHQLQERSEMVAVDDEVKRLIEESGHSRVGSANAARCGRYTKLLEEGLESGD